MRMAGERLIPAQRQQVWEALNDPEILRRSIPGCQSLEKEADHRFSAVAEVKVGPIGARFKGAVALSAIDPPHSYVISGQGSGGIAGSAKGLARVRLSEADGGTLLRYEVEAEVGGRLAQIGGPIIDATAKLLAGRFFDTFSQVVVPQTAQSDVGASSAPIDTPVAALPPHPSFRGTPWGWVAALAVAVLAGFLLGRANAMPVGVGVVALLVCITAFAGFQAGARGRGAA